MKSSSTYSPNTAKTQYVDAGSNRYAYRRIGRKRSYRRKPDYV